VVLQKIDIPEDLDFKQCAGVLVSTWHLPTPDSVLKKLYQWNLPMSIWLENEALLPSLPHLMQRKNTAWFSISYSAASGREMGKSLKQRNHHHVLYISPYHAATWSQNRLAGLTEIVERVDVLSDNRFSDAWGFQNLAMTKLEKSQQKKCLEVPELLKNSLPISRKMHSKWRSWATEFMQDLEVLQALKPLINKAMKSQATAWVFASDHCAILAHQLIPAHKGPTLIASFDNTPEACAMGFDSFEFNTRGMARAMIEHVLNPSNPLYTTGKLRQPKGHVVQRRKLTRKEPRHSFMHF